MRYWPCLLLLAVVGCNRQDAECVSRIGRKVAAKMTLTAQGCGMGPVIAADAKAKLEEVGTQLNPMTPEAFAKFLESELAKYAKLVKAANVSID